MGDLQLEVEKTESKSGGLDERRSSRAKHFSDITTTIGVYCTTPIVNNSSKTHINKGKKLAAPPCFWVKMGGGAAKPKRVFEVFVLKKKQKKRRVEITQVDK